VGPHLKREPFDHQRARVPLRSRPLGPFWMRRLIVRGGAKLVVASIAAYALYAAAQSIERRTLSSWNSVSRIENVIKPIAGGRSSSSVLRAEQRGAVSASGCADQTWPNISPDCITGRVEPLRQDVMPIDTDITSSTLLRPTRVPNSELIDPSNAGLLPIVAHAAAPALSRDPRASSATHEKRHAIKPRSHTRIAGRETRRTPAPTRSVTQAPNPYRPSQSRPPIQFSMAERDSR